MNICLSMIVKNESHCIKRCLDSVKPFIDYWIICDTGSWDGTQDIIKNFMSDIPGEIHQHEWQDFSHNRNLSLELAKKHGDYVLIIDADDYLQIDDPFVFSNIMGPAYSLEILHGSIKYSRTQLVHSSINCKFRGVLHEYLELTQEISPRLLERCRIIFGGDGARSHDPQKYLKDAEIFERALSQDPHNARYVFYCAQSYRDAGLFDKAANMYLQRVTMGGWQEERYISMLEATKCYQTVNPKDWVNIEKMYLKAHNLEPKRAESLYYLVQYCRNNKQYDKAYFYSKVGSSISSPKEGLFIETACYQWKMLDELAIAAFYIGKIEEAKTINEELLKNPYLPQQEIERVVKNLQFCNDQIY